MPDIADWMAERSQFELSGDFVDQRTTADSRIRLSGSAGKGAKGAANPDYFLIFGTQGAHVDLRKLNRGAE